MEKCNGLVSIPNNETEQKVESLNAGIATSILLSELTRPR
ncbi:MAG: tRNA G18 (ribose-2'-O)-methylase SpoU [Bacteroidia bacterium]